MEVEVDQSIKIEQTSRDTFIGLSNNNVFVVRVRNKVKRKLQREFRSRGKPRLFVYRTFIAAIVLALKHAKFRNLSRVVIDVEYVGQNQFLKEIFWEMWIKVSRTDFDVHFREIGKRSLAHEACFSAMKRRRKPDKELTYSEIRRLVLN